MTTRVLQVEPAGAVKVTLMTVGLLALTLVVVFLFLQNNLAGPLYSTSVSSVSNAPGP
jgi:hypothetical protein